MPWPWLLSLSSRQPTQCSRPLLPFSSVLEASAPSHIFFVSPVTAIQAFQHCFGIC